ncbi:SUKH-4 family immunity protein [Nocardia tengchongensis]|uniref:SUKH-4 family immunity protein n=1 Tax=Nocardia tengchongensis TaxID=2055889 RepID=UPI0036C0442D
MTSVEEYRRVWEIWGGSISIPIDAWKLAFEAPDESYPNAESIPLNVSFVYSALPGRMELYSQVDLKSHPDDAPGVLSTILIGTVPDDDSILYLFDVNSGSVIQIDLQDGIPEVVNSTLRAFIDFLYYFAIFADADHGADGRPERARALRSKLEEIDPEAFSDRNTWWSTIFAGLESV